jgi:CDP-paratose 2-epimerase
VRDVFHPRDLAALLDAQMQTTRTAGQRIYTAGGGPENAMSLAELNAWCDARFGPQVPQPDPRPRPYDIPWLIMDNCDAQRTFGWRVEVPIDTLLSEIADHAERNPDWLEKSGL